MQIDLLADRPSDIEVLAPPLVEHWRYAIPDETLEKRRDKLRLHLNRSSVPLAWVAHDAGSVLGTAALRVHDLEGFEHLTPWLAGVFVLPAHRRRGIGAALCRHVESAAAQLGHQQLFLFTSDQQSLYEKLGWQYMTKASWRGLGVDVMTKRPVV